MPDAQWTPMYEPWRHGGWYVVNLHYPSGAVGCVSRNYEDHKWRIACGNNHDQTFPNRDAAARAERDKALAEYAKVRADINYRLYREVAQALPSELRRRVACFAHTDVVLRVACEDEQHV
jgi:hypothetical protein